MVKDLFIHSCILISFLFLGGAIFKRRTNATTMKEKWLLGTLAGLLGSVLMIFSIQVTPTILMDLRHIAIMTSAFYGGFHSAMVSVIIILTSRIVFFSGSKLSILVTIIVMLSIAIVSALISKTVKANEFTRWTIMGTFSLAAMTVGFLSLLGFSNEVMKLLFNYWVITTLAGILVFFLAQYIVQSNRMFAEMERNSSTDFLTGLNNVRKFDTALNASIQFSREQGQPLSLLMIDIDHFKKVNDQHGHQAGDEVLRQLGSILSSCSRSTDIVSRNGGEEFTVLLLESAHRKAMEKAERIRFAVEKHLFILPNGKGIKVTVSIGVSTYPETAQEPEDFLKQADDNLYEAKRTGRNRVV